MAHRVADGTREGAAASDWLRPLVVGGPRPIVVLGVSGPACYLAAQDGTVVALEAGGAGVMLPNAFALDPHGPGVTGLAAGDRGRLGGGALWIRDRTVVVGRWWDPRPRIGALDPAQLRRRAAALPGRARDHAPYGLAGPVDDLRSAARRSDPDGVVASAGDLIGRGPGSTPAGDDVLAGMLATLRVLGGAHVGATRVADALAGELRITAHRTRALSATLLQCAEDGAVVGAARRVLEALAGDADLAGPMAALARLGHTSGHDLLIGIGIAVELVTTGKERT
jgi:hypothetical protein